MYWMVHPGSGGSRIELGSTDRRTWMNTLLVIFSPGFVGPQPITGSIGCSDT